ncbi:hypothetical protein NSTC731_06465 [Nostoc sp. DSM 114167]|jgi:hypothetical protein
MITLYTALSLWGLLSISPACIEFIAEINLLQTSLISQSCHCDSKW